MSKHAEVIAALKSGMKFSWNLDGIHPFEPQGEVVHTIATVEEAAIGWVMQSFAPRALYNSNLSLSFEPTPSGINVYYERN